MHAKPFAPPECNTVNSSRRRARKFDEPPHPTESGRTRTVRALLLQGLFARLDRMRVLASLLRFAQRTGLIRLAGIVGLSEFAKLAPQIPDRFFVARNQRFETARAQGIAFLHVGCVMQVAFPSVHEATVRMLRRAGLSVVVPRDQGCCGAIAVHAGEMDFGRELAKRNIESFERSGADVYVVDAAGCGSALKEYGELFDGDARWERRAKSFSERVRDVTEVLDAMEYPLPTKPLNDIVTYQEPCHLVHAQRVSAAPRRLLAKIPGLRLVEMPESSVCCGSAGIYNFTQPEMAARLQKRKIANVVTTGARIVATANPGCAMQVAAGLRDAAPGTIVKHVVELLDDAYPR